MCQRFTTPIIDLARRLDVGDVDRNTYWRGLEAMVLKRIKASSRPRDEQARTSGSPRPKSPGGYSPESRRL